MSIVSVSLSPGVAGLVPGVGRRNSIFSLELVVAPPCTQVQVQVQVAVKTGLAESCVGLSLLGSGCGENSARESELRKKNTKSAKRGTLGDDHWPDHWPVAAGLSITNIQGPHFTCLDLSAVGHPPPSMYVQTWKHTSHTKGGGGGLQRHTVSLGMRVGAVVYSMLRRQERYKMAGFTLPFSDHTWTSCPP